MHDTLCCCRATRCAARFWDTRPLAEAKACFARAGTSLCCEWRACNHTVLACERRARSKVRAARGVAARLASGCGADTRMEQRNATRGRRAPSNALFRQIGLARLDPPLLERLQGRSVGVAAAGNGRAVGASALRAARAMRRVTHVRQAPMALALSRHTHTCGRRRRRREARRRRRSTKQAPVKRASDMPLPRTQSAYAFCSSLHFFSARFFMRWISAAEQTRSKHRQLRPGVRSHAAAMRRAARTHPPPLSSTPAGCAGPSHSWRQRCEAAAERSTRELCALSRLALRCSAPLRTRH